MPASTVTVNIASGISAFSFTIGAETRTLTYTGGRIRLPAVLTPFVCSLSDFAWLVTEVDFWLDTIEPVVDPPATDPQLVRTDFTIGPLHTGSKTYTASIAQWFVLYGSVDEVSIRFDQFGGNVTFAVRPAATVLWESVNNLNDFAKQFITAARTGVRT